MFVGLQAFLGCPATIFAQEETVGRIIEMLLRKGVLDPQEAHQLGQTLAEDKRRLEQKEKALTEKEAALREWEDRLAEREHRLEGDDRSDHLSSAKPERASTEETPSSPAPTGRASDRKIDILEAGWNFVDQEKIIVYGAIAQEPSASMDSQGTIRLNCIRHEGARYQAIMRLYSNPADPGSLCWRLDTVASSQDETMAESVMLDPQFNLQIPCLRFMGLELNVNLGLFVNPADPDHLYWGLTATRPGERSGSEPSSLYSSVEEKGCLETALFVFLKPDISYRGGQRPGQND